ncbi:MAG: hypothetical protein HC871_04705 [Rhizobiales bacterium]|nr:hypothetical protein [Hyphomicrobiales bacterium]
MLALPELDQKLWVALAMPTRDVDIDAATLDALDIDKDGRIRVHDILSAVAWIKGAFKDAGKLLVSADSVALSQIADAKLLAAAKRVLVEVGKGDAAAVSVADATSITEAFANTVLNGDGVVIPASAKDPDLVKTIEDIITCHGSVMDRSGKPGVDKAKATAFFAEIDAHEAWASRATNEASTLFSLGDRTVAAADALDAVADKLEDFFTRCRLAAYDERAATTLTGQEADFQALSGQRLDAASEAIARLPLSARMIPTYSSVCANLPTFMRGRFGCSLGTRSGSSVPKKFASLTGMRAAAGNGQASSAQGNCGQIWNNTGT